MPELSPDLLKAYLTSDYAVHCPEGPVHFRVGDGLPESLHRPFALITAWNPRSRLLDRPSNDARQGLLLAEVRARGWDYWMAQGRGKNGWCEEGLAILDIAVDDALELTRSFEQHALVWGDGRRACLLLSDGRQITPPATA